MSTRCTVHFHENEGDEGIRRPVAIIYRHFDGYPTATHEGETFGMVTDLARFFEDVAEQCGGYVGYDAGHLATQYAIWQAAELTEEGSGPLAFRSAQLMDSDPSDIQYRYHVYATPAPYTLAHDPEARKNWRPVVTYDERVRGSDEWRVGVPALPAPPPEDPEKLEFLRRWESLDDDARAMLQPHLTDDAHPWISEFGASVPEAQGSPGSANSSGDDLAASPVLLAAVEAAAGDEPDG